MIQIPTQPSELLQKQDVSIHFKAPLFLKTACAKSALGLVTAFIFDIINPLGAAVFSATHSITQSLLWPGVKELLTEGQSIPTDMYIYAVSFLISSIFSITVTVSVGLPMNFLAVAYLSVFMIPTSLLVNYLFNKYLAK